MAVGIALARWASQLFASTGTPVVPFERSTALVRQGPFRISRNPMYLGLVITLIGTAWLLGTASPWLVVPAFVWIMHVRFVRDEERFLEEIFGAEYVEYKKSVRRWI